VPSAAPAAGAEVRPGPGVASQRRSPACARWATSNQRPAPRFPRPTCVHGATGISPSPTARPATRGRQKRGLLSPRCAS